MLYHAVQLVLFMAGWVEGVILRPYDYCVSPKSLALFFFFLQGQLDFWVCWDRGLDLDLTTFLAPMCEKDSFTIRVCCFEL